MLGAEELKEKIEITDTKVECPVKGCSEIVEKMTNETKGQEFRENFRCPRDRIVISPSTFQYPNVSDNLLWKEQLDLELLERIKVFKRRCRMEHDNCEDAVCWNVFRFLEKNNLVERMLSSITNTSPKSSEVIYWSYSQKEDAGWSPLNTARDKFGETRSQGSEPDIIIHTDRALFFIEAKLDAPNKKNPPKKDPSYISRRKKKYLTGGENWFFKVFHSEFEKVVNEGLYELLRFWILGTWMADQQKVDFYLINLVRSKREADIEAIFGKHIKENQRRKFPRVTWESIFQYISESEVSSDKEIMMRYFRNKTIGYKSKKAKGIEKGILQKAFSIP